MVSPELCRVNVNIRARPLNNREKSECARLCLQLLPGTNKLKVGDKIFVFDNVFPPESKQDEVYEESAGPLLEKFFKGYNCCLLAYGQTGAGKTHTMGTEETKESMYSSARGIIPRIASGLFEMIDSSSQPSSYAVSVSMLEVYQDDVVDLLSGNKDNLQIREKSGSVFVQGLSQSTVGSLDDTMTELERGCLVRTKGSTAMNATSSRSHAVFTIHLSKTAVDESECSFTAKFDMVDLAGSERLKKTQAEGERKREGIKINEGLLALGNVISALAEGSRHIPYRDSKITRILQDSLGGNSMTVMIACISPAETNAEETLSTLRYAERTKKIENNAQVNVDQQQALLVQLREENLRLRTELSQLKGDGTPMQPMSATNAVNNGLASAQEALVLDKKLQRMDLQLAEMAAQKLALQSQLCKEINSTASQVEPMDTDGDDGNENGEEADDGEDSDEHDETFAQKFFQREDNLSKEMEGVFTQFHQFADMNRPRGAEKNAKDDYTEVDDTQTNDELTVDPTQVEKKPKPAQQFRSTREKRLPVVQQPSTGRKRTMDVDKAKGVNVDVAGVKKVKASPRGSHGTFSKGRLSTPESGSSKTSPSSVPPHATPPSTLGYSSSGSSTASTPKLRGSPKPVVLDTVTGRATFASPEDFARFTNDLAVLETAERRKREKKEKKKEETKAKAHQDRERRSGHRVFTVGYSSAFRK